MAVVFCFSTVLLEIRFTVVWKYSLSDSDFFQSGMSLQTCNASKTWMRPSQISFESPTYCEFQNKTVSNIYVWCDGFATSVMSKKMLQVEVPYKKFEKDLFRLKRIYSLLYLFMHIQCKINWLQENNISIRSFSVTMSKSKKRIFNFVTPESERNLCMSCVSKYCTVLSWKQLN